MGYFKVKLNKVMNQPATISPYLAAEWVDSSLLTVKDDVDDIIWLYNLIDGHTSIGQTSPLELWHLF